MVKLTASGTITGYSPPNIREFYQNFPTGEALYKPGGDMSITTTDGSTGNVILFAGGGDPVVQYARFAAGTKIAGGSRSNKTLWYPNNPHCVQGSAESPYPCPTDAYRLCDGNGLQPCVKYRGNAGSVLIERLDADMLVTVDSGGAPIMTGSTVVIKVRASTDSLGGYPTPVKIDTAAWVPDPDSLGGDYSEVLLNGACTGGITNAAPSGQNCNHVMKGSGTLRLVAHVNGKGFVTTVHLRISDAFPILTVNKNPAYGYSQASDSVTFTATMSDGSTVTFAYPYWVWVPDQTPGATQFNCGTAYPRRNPCKIAVREPGTMTIIVVYKGQEKHARAHVDLILCPTRDPFLDLPQVKAGLTDLWNASNPDDPNKNDRRERSMVFYDSAGTIIPHLLPLNPVDSLNGPCEANPNVDSL